MLVGWFDLDDDSVHYKGYVQVSLWHVEPYSIRKIIEFILIYINGPFDRGNQNETWSWSVFEYFDQEDTSSPCIKCWHGFPQYVLLRLNHHVSSCWVLLRCIVHGLAVLTTFKSDVICTDAELSFQSVILSGAGWLASRTTVNRSKQKIQKNISHMQPLTPQITARCDDSKTEIIVNTSHLSHCS